ncbi:unnamed protein product [Cylindrotheca closterium]|uniref:Uncharacterized protein n=1 Tax=Cylindrotheca closterium TaxID=2856 RepID=A0AAD2PU68_9STRA|nr:unnamed protein product [Cylindrotheca closterium]
MEYRYEGNEGEMVPLSAQQLTFSTGVQELPDNLCNGRGLLDKVTLPEGLIKIGIAVFAYCTRLSEIKICYTVESLGKAAFICCNQLTKVDLECSSSSPHHGLKTIGAFVFSSCRSLERIKIPSSVNALGKSVFDGCNILLEAILSTTSITKIPISGFADCPFLQTVSLPNSMESVGCKAFYQCFSLITVIVPLDSKPIEIGPESFYRCVFLANLVLPEGSNADEASFVQCTLLEDRFGEKADDIVHGLVHRFDNFPVQKIAYYNSCTTAEELRQCVEKLDKKESPLVDDFGMTPFHILFSSPEPSQDLFEILLDKFPHYVLGWKDANDNTAMEYLLNNWTRENKALLEDALQSWMYNRLDCWRSDDWRIRFLPTMNALLAQEDRVIRMSWFGIAWSALKHFENVESLSILEMALWKWQNKGERNNDGTKRRALDRDQCRSICGADVVIPNVEAFLGIIPSRA